MICNVCRTNKGPEDFYSKDRTCKECRKEKARKYRADNIDKVRAYDRSRGQTKERKDHVKKYVDRMKKEEPERWSKMRYEACKKYRAKNPEKWKAVQLANNKQRSGKIKKGPCDICGSLEVQAHHPDYSKPDQIVWLCGPHHRETHRNIESNKRGFKDQDFNGYVSGANERFKEQARKILNWEA